jgi:flagellar motor switch protein FliN/FliY
MSDEQVADPAPASAPEELSAEAPKASTGEGGGRIDLDLLMDVQVQLSVEIGRARLPIRELLALNQGSIVSLDRDVNEPLDLMINGTLIARGEVVESDGRFGLRLLDVVSPGERLKKLK